MKTYRHDFLVYAIFPAMFCLVAYWGYESWREGAQPGAETARYAFLTFVVVWILFTGYLFINYALVRYHLTEDGLMIKKLWSTKVRAWPELKSLKINHNLKYMVVRDTANKVIVFTSLDYFKDIREFVEVIEEKIESAGT